MDNVSKLYEELISFSDLYDSASFEAKENDCQSAYPQGRCLSWVSAQHYLQLRPYAVHWKGMMQQPARKTGRKTFPF